MPPKKPKQIDPQLQQEQFEKWKDSDEFRVWNELKIISKSLDTNISETTKDLTGNWQVYHNKLFELCQVFKCKPKFKFIDHVHIRSAFFAQEDIEINKQIIKQYIDGIYCSVEKLDKDRGNHVKQAFAKIYRTLEDHKFLEMSAENYQAERKNLQTLLNEFTKKLPILIKISHKLIEERLMQVTAPLRALLEINKKLMFFDLRNTAHRDRMIRDFIIKADIEQYCICLQECERILLETQAIKANPNVKLIFNKLGYENWQTNKIESFYLKPLLEAFEKMRRNLFCLMLKGINFYKAPLMENQQFVIDINEVIKAELISEHLLGSALKRDQINFVYNVLSVIFHANPQAREFLQKKDENCIKGSIPKLIAYHTILYMRAWKDRKKEDDLKQMKQEQQDQLKQTQLQHSQLQSTQDENLANAQSNIYVSPERKRQMEEEQKKKEEEQRLAEETAREKEQQSLMQKYGRYWLWDFYCTQENRQIFEDCVERVRHINKAVQQDIEDEIIKEGMIPKIRNRQMQQNDPSLLFNELRKKDYDNQYVLMRRPPELWNYPKVIDEEHQFRAIADPKKCYIDQRIENLEERINQLANHLQTYKPQTWKELIERVVDALKETYIQEPTQIDEQ
ncbi:unnamed protein product [Paramecium octaurelia]|uniref:Uncharacterized protein n=1 Tax=Paramecium octaurelia TaxID=43137 RepID=A0A8S1SKS3_PAROT|nr:unnamed protein product [Paramecium octaurelia]